MSFFRLPSFLTAQAPKDAGPSVPFDYARLKGRARALARAPYVPPPQHLPEALRQVTWDGYESIAYRPDHQLWANRRLHFRAAFFLPGLSNRIQVRLHEVVDGRAREIAFDPAMFDYGRSGIDGAKLPPDTGFAGFRIFARPDFKRDVAAFLGASYFRAVGQEKQYGMSARGLSIDTGTDRPEEFPIFTEFWLERPSHASSVLTVCALLDSPSVAGAYRFLIAPGRDLVMDVDAALYPRRKIEHLGVAPLTSMFYCGYNDRGVSRDWRPNIHDSDGLALWTGPGEWIWRPLTNPPLSRLNSYQDHNPRGFGLWQRDRSFADYQDDGAWYNLRPGVWVEPKGSWGRGAVKLLEFPAPNETVDNVVAFWNPARPPEAGEEALFAYRLYWGSRMPVSPPLARTAATWTGIGGNPGRLRPYFSWRFVVDFAGGDLAELPENALVQPIVTVSRGRVEVPSAHRLESIRGYRAIFDLRPTDTRPDPYDLRLYLRLGERALTETWMYQWTLPADHSPNS